MANRWLFVGGHPGTLDPIDSTSPGSTTTTSLFNTTYSDSACSIRNNMRGVARFNQSDGTPDSAVAGETLWLTFYYHNNSAGGNVNNNMAEFLNSSDEPVMALRYTSSNYMIGLFYNSGTPASPAWTAVPGIVPTSVINSAAYIRVRISIDAGGNHTAQLVQNTTDLGSGSFTQASLTSIHAVKFLHPSGSALYALSEVAASVGINLVGCNVMTAKPNAAGTTNTFTSGSHLDLDEAGISDADFIASQTAAQRALFNVTNLPALPVDYGLGQMFLYTRARNDGVDGPQSFTPLWRNSSGVVETGATTAATAAFAMYLQRFNEISEADFNSSEFGLDSAA